MKIAIVGTGYVGLVSGLCFASAGHEVVFVDKDSKKVDALNAARSPIHEDGLQSLLDELKKKERLVATQHIETAMVDADISMICVGTPSRPEGSIDLSYVETAAAEIGHCLRSHSCYHVVMVRSTVIPKTTMETVAPALERSSGKKLGAIGLAMVPEFLREGSALKDAQDPDRIVIGTFQQKTFEICKRLYSHFSCPVVHTTPENAELIKYASNTLLANLISYSNDIGHICESIPGADAMTVMQNVHLDRRFTRFLPSSQPEVIRYLEAGIGYGGSCFPKDVKAFASFAAEHGVSAPTIQATMEVNERRPGQIIDQLEAHTGPLVNKKIAVIGLAFKPDTDDIRESPALRLVDILLSRGAIVSGYERTALKNIIDKYRDVPNFSCSARIDHAVSGAHGALLALADPNLSRLDWNMYSAQMTVPFIFDGRNVLSYDPLRHQFQYAKVGSATKDVGEPQDTSS